MHTESITKGLGTSYYLRLVSKTLAGTHLNSTLFIQFTSRFYLLQFTWCFDYFSANVITVRRDKVKGLLIASAKYYISISFYLNIQSFLFMLVNDCVLRYNFIRTGIVEYLAKVNVFVWRTNYNLDYCVEKTRRSKYLLELQKYI